jgi:hypothetical protein
MRYIITSLNFFNSKLWILDFFHCYSCNCFKGGVFKAVSWTDGLLENHISMNPKTKNDFKLLFMLPTQCTTPSDDVVESVKEFLISIWGFKSQCVFKIDPSSGDYTCAWLYSWIIEVYFDSEVTDPISAMEDIRSSETFSREWKICIMKDNVQLKPSDV